jgi:ankyrin repeat protein
MHLYNRGGIHMIIRYIFNHPIIAFLMPILFLWSAIKIVKYFKEKKSFGSIPLVYRLTCLASLTIIILSITFARRLLTVLTTIVSVGLYLLVRVSIEIFKKIKNKEPIGIKQFVILFFSLVIIDFIIIFIIGLFAGLGHSSTEIALAPPRVLLSFIIVVVSPIVALLLYNYFRFSKPGKKKRTYIISYGVVIVLALLIALVWLRTAGWPPIVYAARHGHYGLAKFLLDMGADANAYDKYRDSTPLLYTAWNDDVKMAGLLVTKGAKAGSTEWFHVCLRNRLEIAKMILEKGQDPNIRFTKMNTSPLLVAVSYNHPDMVKLLLEYGADVYFVGEKKQNALDIAREKGFSRIEQLLLNPRVKYNIKQVKQISQIRLLQAVSRGKFEQVRALLDQGADINVKEKKSGQTPLISASFKQRKNLVQLLLDKGADVHARDINGETALMAAAAKGNTSIVKMLLEKGAHVNAEDRQKKTALVHANYNDHHQIRELLLKHGADPVYLNIFTKKIENNKEVQVTNIELHWTLQQTKDPKIRNLLAAVALGDINKVNGLLNKEIINKKIYSLNGGTVLSWAAHCNQPRLVKRLIEKGAKVDARNNHNITPLTQAARLGHLEVVKILIDNGADVNAASKKGWTSLMWSGENGHVEVVRFLLQSGVDKSPKNNRGKTAVEIAEAKGQQEVVKILKEEE